MSRGSTAPSTARAEASSPPQPLARETLFSPDDDRLHEECGVVGVFGIDDASALTTLGSARVAAPWPGSRWCCLVRWSAVSG